MKNLHKHKGWCKKVLHTRTTVFAPPWITTVTTDRLCKCQGRRSTVKVNPAELRECQWASSATPRQRRLLSWQRRQTMDTDWSDHLAGPDASSLLRLVRSAPDSSGCNPEHKTNTFHPKVYDTRHRRRNRGGNGGACPRNAEGVKVPFRPRNNLPSFSGW